MLALKHNLTFLPGWGYRASVMSSLTPYFKNHDLHFNNLPDLTNHDEIRNLSDFAATLPAKTALIGWSLGGLVAIKLCSLFPDQFTKLILLASTPKFAATSNWTGISTNKAAAFSNNAKHNLKTTINEFHKMVSRPTHALNTFDHFSAHGSDDTSTCLLHSLEYLFKNDLRDDFSALKQPVLSIAASHDAILPPGTHNHHIIQHAGHGFFYTHATQTSKLIHDFLGNGVYE